MPRKPTSAAVRQRGRQKRKGKGEDGKSYKRDPVTAYAKDVLSDRIIAGELVKFACERHLRDLKDGPKRGLHWVPPRMSHALNFYPSVLTVTAGAMAGRPFNLLPYHAFCTGSLFGWYRGNGLRRFRRSWTETGKGQAKSPWMAATGLYILGFCGIPRAEVYAIAEDKDQANVLFKDAVAMCRATIPDEEDGVTLETRDTVIIRGVGDNAWKIEHPLSGSKFQSLANSGAISGPRPAAILADEIHEFKSDEQIEMWQAALAKMPGDPLMMLGTNTPASNQIVGTAYSEYFQRVVKNEFADDAAFVYIARVDKKDKPLEDERCWQKSLPALGITYSIDNIRDEVTTAKKLLSKSLTVQRLYFGIPVGSSAFWIDEPAWREVQGVVDPEKLKGSPCWLSLDLSQKNDLTALTAVWRDAAGHLWAKTWYWTPKDGLLDRARADVTPYDLWVAEKLITAVPGPVIDKSFVAAEVKKIYAEHNIQALAFDPAGIDDFTKACDEAGLIWWKWEGPETIPGTGLMMVSHAQGPRIRFEEKQLCMPRSIERLEDAILKKMITIETSKVTDSCAANAAVDEDGQGNRAFNKKRSRGRIDGLVTLAMGTGAAMMSAAEVSTKSFWDA